MKVIDFKHQQYLNRYAAWQCEFDDTVLSFILHPVINIYDLIAAYDKNQNQGVTTLLIDKISGRLEHLIDLINQAKELKKEAKENGWEEPKDKAFNGRISYLLSQLNK